MSALDDGSWRTPTFRQSVVAKIDEAIRTSGMPTTKNSMEMENHVFQKAKSKEEYLGFVARLILHVREMNSKKGGGIGVPGGGPGNQAAQDPIGALQNLARQGTGNQMMGLGGPQGGGGMVQPPSIPATSLLQTLNQRPQGLSGMQPIQDKMATGIGMGPGPQVGQMVGMPGQMQSGPMSNVACPSQIPSQMRMQLPGQMGGQLQGQIQGQSMGQMPQMPGQITNQMSHMTQMQQPRKERGPGEGSDLAVDREVRSPSFNSLASTSPSSDVTSTRIATPKTFSRKRKMPPSYAALSLVNDRSQDLGKEDVFEITGKNVASKLRTLTKEQRIIAEKLINDVLYEAQLGSLTSNSRLIVSAPHRYTSPMVHSYYGTEPVTVGSAQHSQCTAEPVDQ